MVQPPLTGSEGEFDNGRQGEARGHVAGTHGALGSAIVEVLSEHIEGPETAPVGRRVIDQLAPGEVREERKIM